MKENRLLGGVEENLEYPDKLCIRRSSLGTHRESLVIRDVLADEFREVDLRSLHWSVVARIDEVGLLAIQVAVQGQDRLDLVLVRITLEAIRRERDGDGLQELLRCVGGASEFRVAIVGVAKEIGCEL